MSRRVGPTERMLILLNRLATHPRRIWHVDELRGGIPGYERTAGGDRNWQLDCEALRSRGVIRTGITDRYRPRRTGVQYALPVKPVNLHLSEREHAALVNARRAGGIADIPSPLAGDSVRGSTLETILGALRRLEERGEWMTIGELAREMAERPDRLLKKLNRAWCLDFNGCSLLDRVFTVDALDGEKDLSAAEVRVCVIRGDEAAPLNGKGLAMLSTGAYTLEEIEERLALIEGVLTEDLPGDAVALDSARSKLLQWREMLLSAQEGR